MLVLGDEDLLFSSFLHCHDYKKEKNNILIWSISHQIIKLIFKLYVQINMEEENKFLFIYVT